MIIQTEMDVDQIDDSVLDISRYTQAINLAVKEKDFFKAALEYQEIVKERY
jgi:hypothetical protein